MDWAIPKSLFPFPLQDINFLKYLFGEKNVSDCWDYLILHGYEHKFETPTRRNHLETF